MSLGRHPVRLLWFNGVAPSDLQLEYEGPGLSRQLVPAAVLFHASVDQATGQTSFVSGLEYCCHEGNGWNALPDFDWQTPVKTGIASHFDPSVRSREYFFAVEFSGYLQVPQTGRYTFHLKSKDGSALFIGPPPYRLHITGQAPVPPPESLVLGQTLNGAQNSTWAKMQGVVSFVTDCQGRLEFELKSEAGRIQVQILDRTGISPSLLLNSRVQVVGVCHSILTLDGKETSGVLMVPGWRQFETLELTPTLWKAYPVKPIRDLSQIVSDDNGERIAHVQGRLHAAGLGQPLEIQDQTGTVAFLTAQPLSKNDGMLVDVLGVVAGSGTNLMIACGFNRQMDQPVDAKAAALPLLTTAAQVKELNRAEAIRGYPVLVRGIVVGLVSGYTPFFIQDQTSGIFVSCRHQNRLDPPEIGELWEIEGITAPGYFAPTVVAQKNDEAQSKSSARPSAPHLGSVDQRQRGFPVC